jgi:hypothetical protein
MQGMYLAARLSHNGMGFLSSPIQVCSRSDSGVVLLYEIHSSRIHSLVSNVWTENVSISRF